jgi:hypothetical protein
VTYHLVYPYIRLARKGKYLLTPAKGEENEKSCGALVVTEDKKVFGKKPKDPPGAPLCEWRYGPGSHALFDEFDSL